MSNPVSRKGTPRDLSGWLEFIEACHPEEIDLGLSRIRQVADQLGLKQLACRVITVAGTNGKGSTVALMDSILQHAGYRVGCYTSPHFLRYNERVRINGTMVDDHLLCDAFARIHRACTDVELDLTYFEYGTLAALVIFGDQPLDVVLLEVGLGGRLDAVNIVDPDVSVVTTIAIDHEAWLGNDREAIAREKAGIFREGRPAVYGEADMPSSIATQAAVLNCDLYHWGDRFRLERQPDARYSVSGVNAQGGNYRIDHLHCPALPPENAATAIQALHLLGVTLPVDAIRQGVSQAQLTGRMQRREDRGRQVLLDVAHNPHAAGYIAQRIPGNGALWCVVGMLTDKDGARTLEALGDVVDHWCLATLPGSRGRSAQDLYATLKPAQQKKAACFDDCLSAYENAIQASAPGDRILVMGSFLTLAAVLGRPVDGTA